jgi:hypothetical protein
MKVGDLIMIKYKGYQGHLAIVVQGIADHNETRVQMVSDGAVLWFLTKELEVIG